jgi:hypothetical protein
VNKLKSKLLDKLNNVIIQKELVKEKQEIVSDGWLCESCIKFMRPKYCKQTPIAEIFRNEKDQITVCTGFQKNEE